MSPRPGDVFGSRVGASAMGAKKWPESLNQYFAGVDMELSNLMLHVAAREEFTHKNTHDKRRRSCASESLALSKRANGSQ